MQHVNCGYSRWLLGAMLTLVPLLGTTNCADESAKKASAAQLADGCVINTDCKSPLVCAFRRCHTECATSRDCDDGARCVASDRPFHVCQQDDERDCEYNSECPANMACATDGECRDQCEGNRDCVPEQVCTSGVCADSDELDNGVLPTVVDTEAIQAGQKCSYNSDCTTPLICRNGQCSAECIEDIDCSGGGECVQSRCQTPPPPPPPATTSTPPPPPPPPPPPADAGVDASVTPPPPTAECVYNSDCVAAGTGALCITGVCRAECVTDVDCQLGASCNAGLCAFNTPAGAPTGYGAACSVTSDCAPRLVCGGLRRCVYECYTNVDCAPDFCCSSINTCVTGSVCQAPTDAGPIGPITPTTDAAGMACGGDLECQDGVVCNGFERCVAGICQAAADLPCDDKNPCTNDTCNETNGTCAHVATGTIDFDQDGYFAASCGGTGNDCDDRNADVHPGLVETCDGVDNNCDGQIDEGMWNAGPLVTLVGDTDAGARTYPSGHGPPDITRRADGSFYVAAVNDLLEVDLWQLNPSLQTTAGPVHALVNATSYSSHSISPTLATDGVGLTAGIGIWTDAYACDQDYFRSRIATGPDIGSLTETDVFTRADTSCNSTWYLQRATRPDITHDGSRYIIGWTDDRDGTTRAYLTTMTNAGAISATSRMVFPVPADSAPTVTSSATFPTVMLASTPSRLYVSFAANNAGGDSVPRYGVFDPVTMSLLAGPFNVDQASPGGQVANVAVHGSNAILVYGAANEIALYEVDGTTGALGASLSMTTNAGSPAPRLSPLTTGHVLTFVNGSFLRFGWAPSDFTRGFTLVDINRGGSGSAANIAPVSDSEVVLSWVSGGQVVVTTLTCGG